MAVLRIRVKCYRCNQEVEKGLAIAVKSINREPRYSCYDCYRKQKIIYLRNENQTKKELFCERCRYKFVSKSTICPYCDKDDQVEEANVRVGDLL